MRQLAAAFLRRKLASGIPSSKLETQKRQQAAALQSAPSAAVERAGAPTGAGGEVMKMLEPVETPLPSHPHVSPRRDIGASQTSNHDVCATRLPLQALADGPVLNIPRFIAGRRWVASARDCAFSLCNLRFNRVNAGCPNELGADWKYQLQWAGSRSMPAELQALVRTNKSPSPNHLVGLSVVAAANSDSVVPVAHAHTNLAKRSVTQLIRG